MSRDAQATPKTNPIPPISLYAVSDAEITNLEKIQSASADLAEMQEALANLQAGLAKAEQVALAAEEAKRRSEQLLRVAAGLLGLLLLINLISALRRRR